MADQSRRKLKIATVVYWVLLIYIVAALVWWTIMLLEQADTIYTIRKENLLLIRNELSETAYLNHLKLLHTEWQRSIYKYVGEGVTILLLILVGAVYIYRLVRNEFRLQLQQQNFAMAVTHELKTPIAVSRLNLETLQKYALDEEKRQKLLQMTLTETLRLDDLINNILISSQLEVNHYTLHPEETDISALADNFCNQFQHRYPQRTLQRSIQPNVMMKADPVLMKLLLSNLLENAHKYSPSGGKICVEVVEKDGVQLTITDEGGGIPDDEKKNIFKKFYRIGNESIRRTQGTGLGLFISKKIVKDHGGSISVEANVPKGSKFVVHFPTAHGK